MTFAAPSASSGNRRVSFGGILRLKNKNLPMPDLGIPKFSSVEKTPAIPKFENGPDCTPGKPVKNLVQQFDSTYTVSCY